MARDAKESPAEMPREPDPEKYAALIAELRTRQSDTYGLVPSRYFRWISGDVPDVVRWLVENRELAAAVYEDAVRYALEHPKPPTPRPEEK